MDQKVHANKKYSHVSGKLYTGLTVDKVKYITARECAMRRDEIFYRVSADALFHLYSEYEGDDENESILEVSSSGRSLGPRIVTHSQDFTPEYSRPYLILDVREEHIFADHHLMQAKSFPSAYLKRDQLHPEVYRFKNKEDSLIILYCDDERVSKDCAKIMVDRGIDNVYLLTGGIQDFLIDYPSFIEGKMPNIKQPSPTSRRANKNRFKPTLVKVQETENDISAFGGLNLNSFNLTANTNAYRSPLSSRRPSDAGKSARGSPTYSPTSRQHRDDRSESGRSTRSNFSVAESIISRAQSRRGKF